MIRLIGISNSVSAGKMLCLASRSESFDFLEQIPQHESFTKGFQHMSRELGRFSQHKVNRWNAGKLAEFPARRQ
jgi:hypothetical protein